MFSYKLLTFLFAFVFTALTIGAQTKDPVDEAWQAWGENKQAEVEAKLTAILKQSPANTRASLALFFLYRMQEKQEKAWEALKPVLQSKDNPYPYICAEWTSQALLRQLNAGQPEALALLTKLSTSADPDGMLKPMANERLGQLYRSKGNLLKSDEAYKALNAVKVWSLIGPFENISAGGFEKAFPPEKEFAPTQTYSARNGVPTKWFVPPAWRPDFWVDFRRYFAAEQSVFYANSFVYSPKKQVTQFRVGTSGAVKVFLNDQAVLSYFEESDNDVETFVVETELQEGWNRVLVKIGISEIEECNFLLRLTDRSGEALSDLQFSTELKPYTARPGAPVKPVENFAEAFFKAKIQAAPEQLENYVLLADAYLRSDKAIEAELILKDALKRLPNSALLLTRLLQAYSAGDKNDEYYSTNERLATLDKNIPLVIENQINSHLEREEFDKAEALLKEYERLLPGTESLYELKYSFYSKKDETAKLNALVQTAAKLFPSNWMFVEAQADQLIESTKRYPRAIALVEQYLLKNYETNILTTLASYYLETSNVRKWGELYNKAIELDPAAAGLYAAMASTYFEMKDYANAEKNTRKAQAFCPSCSSYYATLGEIHQIRKETSQAIQNYQEAVRQNPFDYDTRQVLRELQGKPSIWSLFATTNIKQMLAQAPKATDYPAKSAVILLQDVRRAVYPEGASEQAIEYMVKVFNKQGVDSFKEQYLRYNSYTQEISIEKAVVIKPNGTEIKADEQGGQVIFKSLEENDVIYMKWSLKNLNSGQLYKDFWDTQYFNQAYPIKQMRYSLLVPKDFHFVSNAHNMPNQPTVKDTEAGTLHQWSVQDEPGIDVEASMPGLDDIGKVLYVSSLSGWDSLVSWYTDLAQTKTRSSFEIKEQVRQLFADKKEYSEEEKIERVYNFITENIRYSSVSFRQSGLVPQKARDVLVNKIGDCKDVSTLGIAMLNEVGVKSYYTLVNTREAGQNKNALPGIFFNHCIIAVETSKGLRYLDLTAQNYPMSTLPKSDREAFSLLIKPGVKAAALLPSKGETASEMRYDLKVEIKPDFSIQATQNTEWIGETSAYARSAFRYKSEADSTKELTQAYAQAFPGIKMVKTEFKGLTPPSTSAQGVYQFEVPNFITEAGQFKLFRLPWFDRIIMFPAPSSEKRKYPYLYQHYADRVEQQIEIRLPAGYEPLELGKDVTISSPVAEFRMSFSYANGVITAKKEIVNKKAVVTPEEYAEFKQFYNRVAKEEERAILLKAS
jgi:hypothetical protein